MCVCVCVNDLNLFFNPANLYSTLCTKIQSDIALFFKHKIG